MRTISGVSSQASAGWADVSAARAAKKESLFSKLDSDGSGAVDASELQGLLDKVAEKTGTTAQKASDVLSKLDTDGNGTLDKSELKAGIKSLLPAPNSTQDFAQQHVPPAGDPMAKPSDTHGTDAPSGPPPGGPPPAGGGGGGGGGAGGASSSSDATTYDPLDTNQDGVVSAQEQAAGDLKNVLADLLKAIDSNGDKKISESEVDTFQKHVAAALQALSTSGASGTSATSVTSATNAAITSNSASGSSSDASSDRSSSSSSLSSPSDASNANEATVHRHHDFSLSAFAQLVLKQYAATASDASSVGASLSVSV